MKSENNNLKRENSDDKQKRNGTVQKTSGFNNTKKQVTKQKNNKYKQQTREGGKYTDKQQRSAYKNTTRNTSPKNPAKTPSRQGRRGRRPAERLKVIPLGGLEQIGMNITAFEYGESIVVVDCGLSFPEDDMLGIDLVIPDVTYLKENTRVCPARNLRHTQAREWLSPWHSLP